MALVLPYPNKPANGDSLDATVVQANFTAIAQAIQSFDGSQIQAASVQAAAMAPSANPITRGSENFGNYIFTGAGVSNPSGLNVSITGGTFYINGNRNLFVGVGSQTLLANKDYYIDVDNLGNVTYANVANGATAPALTASSVRIALVVTGGAAVTNIVQTGWDNNEVKIYPTGGIGGAQAPTLWYEEIGRSTLLAQAASISILNLPYRKYLRIIQNTVGVGTTGEFFRFNNDSSASYDYRRAIGAAASTINTAQTQLDTYGDPNAQSWGEYDMVNYSTANKPFHGKRTVAYPNGGAGVQYIDISAVWRNTNPITRVDYFSGAAFAAGSEVIITGHN